MESSDNDGMFPDDSPVMVKYPRDKQEEHGDRSAWPWLPGTIIERCGPDEWQVCVEDKSVATRKDGSKPTPRMPQRNLYYPLCFRDSIQPADRQPFAGLLEVRS